MPPQIIINGDGVISATYDQRSPKEVSQGVLESGFSLFNDGNTVDPNILQSLEGGQRIFQQGIKTEIKKDGTRAQGSYGIQKHGPRQFTGRKMMMICNGRDVKFGISDIYFMIY